MAFCPEGLIVEQQHQQQTTETGNPEPAHTETLKTSEKIASSSFSGINQKTETLPPSATNDGDNDEKV